MIIYNTRIDILWYHKPSNKFICIFVEVEMGLVMAGIVWWDVHIKML